MILRCLQSYYYISTIKWNMNIFISLLLLFSVRESSGVVKLIFDTDMDFDVDDVGALCLAHSLQVYTYSFDIYITVQNKLRWGLSLYLMKPSNIMTSLIRRWRFLLAGPWRGRTFGSCAQHWIPNCYWSCFCYQPFLRQRRYPSWCF